MKKPCKTYDLSACVTGVLLAFVCPVTIPYWTIILADAFAILLVKDALRRLGQEHCEPRPCRPCFHVQLAPCS